MNEAVAPSRWRGTSPGNRHAGPVPQTLHHPHTMAPEGDPGHRTMPISGYLGPVYGPRKMMHTSVQDGQITHIDTLSLNQAVYALPDVVPVMSPTMAGLRWSY